MILALFSEQAVSAAFQEPTAPPPEDNTPGYLTTGGEDQVRSGKLRLGIDDLTSPFDYQLEVSGDGAQVNDTVVDNDLTVDTNTLYVDSVNNRVGMGTLTPTEKLSVMGDMTISNYLSVGGLAAYSASEHTIYGTTSSSTHAGLAGFGTATDNYGVAGYNYDGTAVRGINTAGSASSIYGESTNGVGVYGTNVNNLGLWAGYFSGRLESNSDVSGAKFLATQLQSSLVPFTSGQVVENYIFSNIIVKYFDGTHIWGVDDSKLYKIRASDGFKVFEISVGSNPTDVIFDGNFIWVTVAGDDTVVKLDPYSGSTECSLALAAGDSNPQSIAFDGQYYWVILNGTSTTKLIKVNNLCEEQSGARLTLPAPVSSLKKIIYNGSYLWILSSSMVININPSDTSDGVAYTGVVGNNPQDIFFDNYYYWSADKDDDTVTKFYLDSNGVPVVFGTYSTGDGPSYLAFDGTYLWAANVNGQSLTRLLAAFPEQSQSFSLSFTPTGLVFDGTYLWVSGSTGLTKIYSGTGYGMTDLSGTLTLQQNSPLIQQNGSISIDGSGRIGGNITAQGEMEVSNNVWGGESDTVVNVSPGGSENCGPTLDCFNCPEGFFVKNIVTNGAGEVTQIECRPL